ncbi:MAG: M1 family aminopeptidase [Planctomycetota bacterium]|nr:M1 family aminopeptidase [Planctomycetota bacterium]
MHTRAMSSLAVLLAALSGGPVSLAQVAQPLAADEAHAYATSLDELARPMATCGKAEAMRAMFRAGLAPDGSNPAFSTSGGYGPREAATDTDVTNYNIDFEIFPSTRTITGTVIMTVKAVNAVNQFTFVLSDSFTITTITSNGVALGNVAIANGYQRRVNLDRTYNPGETFTFRVSYTGAASGSGFGSITWGTQGGQNLVYTLSQPYYAGTWWCTKDAPIGGPGDMSDKATVQIAITAPSTMVSLSNGLLQGTDTLSGSRKRYRWATNYPTAPYLVFFASTNYNQWTKNYVYTKPDGTTGSMPVQFALYPGSDNASNRAAWEKSVQMLAAFKPVYGEYPFINEKYGMYQFGFSGGMEHQTFTGQGGFWEDVTAHELGHQWWGDNVTCRFWNDIWLNEGFATFSEAVWEERKPGSTGLPAYLSAMLSRRPSALGVDRAVYVTNTASEGAIFNSDSSYRKGAWVVHMLRKVMGDTTFWNTLAAYRAMYQGSAATTDDFRAVCESVSGLNLERYFDQWVYFKGTPTYNYGFTTRTVNGKNYVKMSLRQTQDATFPVYQMPIDVRVTRTGGTSTFVINNDQLSSGYVLPLGTVTGASAITLDPDNWILTKAKNSEAYVTTAPALVEVSPAINATLEAATVSSVNLWFSDPVTLTSGAFTVLRNGTTPVPFSVVNTPAQNKVTLNFSSALRGGSYTITANAAQVTAGGLALDGETPGGALKSGLVASLPSGDGQPGGDATVSFFVNGPACDADFNADGFLDFTDFDAFVSAFEAGGSGADFNADGFVDFTDFDAFVAAFEAGC